MADLLQAPMEEGSTLILHSTGRQRRAHHTFNAPLVFDHDMTINAFW
jgi:hypothetical protein